jgi:hypothetical protein
MRSLHKSDHLSGNSHSSNCSAKDGSRCLPDSMNMCDLQAAPTQSTAPVPERATSGWCSQLSSGLGSDALMSHLPVSHLCGIFVSMAQRILSAADLEKMTPEQRQAAFDASIVTDLDEAPSELLARTRRRVEQRITESDPTSST